VSIPVRSCQNLYEHTVATNVIPPSQLQKSAQIRTENHPQQIRRLCAGLLVISLFIVSCFASGTPGMRGLLAFVPVVALIFAVELTADAGHRIQDREPWRIRRAQLDKARLLRGMGSILIQAIIAWAALLALVKTRHAHTTPSELLRLGAGVALLYSLAAVIFEVVSLLFLAAGYSLPLMHRTPIAACSVGEFWGRRWNIIVSAWLGTYIFLPLARRRYISLGILCAFFVSGLFHGWPILAALGMWPAFTTVAFFVIQGVAVLAEGRLRIHSWPSVVARAWTLIIILASSPLFIDPGLRLFGL
jgi:hypothetical protein